MTITVLADVTIGDGVEQFLEMFSTEGYAKRQEHGCVGTRVLVPGDDSNNVLVLLEWPDEAAFHDFRTDPEGPAIMRRGGAQGPPTFTVLYRTVDFDH
jgi:quinol monooxygenase YgiN